MKMRHLYISPLWRSLRMSSSLMKVAGGAILASAVTSLVGCSTLLNGTTQQIAVSVRSEDGTPVTGAQCTLVNDRGSWPVTAPNATTVHRSLHDLIVTCTANDRRTGALVVKSSLTRVFYGSQLQGLDFATGAAYAYPELVVVALHADAGAASVSTTAPG